MAPRPNVEFVVLRLCFVPWMTPSNPRINHMRKIHSPTGAMNPFDRILATERQYLPDNVTVYYTEWRVVSGNSSIFKVGPHSFEKIIMILGEEKIYWFFYQSEPYFRRLEGHAILPLVYCGCCMHYQYLTILEAVKEKLKETNEQPVVFRAINE